MKEGKKMNDVSFMDLLKLSIAVSIAVSAVAKTVDILSNTGNTVVVYEGKKRTAKKTK